MPKSLPQRVTDLERAVHKLESINTPRKQDPASIGPQPASKNESVDTPGLAALVPPTPANPKKAKQSGETRRPWRKRLWRWIKRIFLKRDRLEKIGIMAGIIYAVVTVAQWRDLRHNFEVDQRAWLKAETGLPVTLAENMSLDKLPITIKNVGKSPALRSIADAAFDVIPRANAPSLTFDAIHTQVDIPLLFPGDDNSFPVAYRSPSKDSTALSNTTIQDLIAGRSYLVVFSQRGYLLDSGGPNL